MSVELNGMSFLLIINLENMGKKLTLEEIGRQVTDHPTLGFDQCHNCNGIETQGEMTYLDENKPFDDKLICHECKNTVSPPEPKERIWKVEVCRTATAFRTIEVIAKTEEEAMDKAIDEAGGEGFGSGEADYSAPNGAY